MALSSVSSIGLFLVVILRQRRRTCFCLAVVCSNSGPPRKRHLDRSNGQFHRPLRSGETPAFCRCFCRCPSHLHQQSSFRPEELAVSPRVPQWRNPLHVINPIPDTRYLIPNPQKSNNYPATAVPFLSQKLSQPSTRTGIEVVPTKRAAPHKESP